MAWSSNRRDRTLSIPASWKRGRRKPILASGISDGHSSCSSCSRLFSEGRNRYSLMLIDEPETSLHPWALAVLAKAIWQATATWGRQVILATHSPVLISQFDPDQLLAVEAKDWTNRITRVSEIADIQDLLQDYATGSLYMSEVVAPQSGPSIINPGPMMTDPSTWPFVPGRPPVTGRGEERFLPRLFRSLEAEGHCSFRLDRWVPQLRPKTSERAMARLVGTGRASTPRDEEIGLAARRLLR